MFCICNQNLNDTKIQCCNNFICDICIFKLCKYTCLFCNQIMKLDSMYKNKMHENATQFNRKLNSAFYHIHPPQSRTY